MLQLRKNNFFVFDIIELSGLFLKEVFITNYENWVFSIFIANFNMLSRKNKDLRTIKDGVVGKYVKKESPPEIPSKYIWIWQPILRLG